MNAPDDLDQFDPGTLTIAYGPIGDGEWINSDTFVDARNRR